MKGLIFLALLVGANYTVEKEYTGTMALAEVNCLENIADVHWTDLTEDATETLYMYYSATSDAGDSDFIMTYAETITMTSDDYITEYGANALTNLKSSDIAADGSTVTFCRNMAPARLTDAQWTSVKACLDTTAPITGTADANWIKLKIYKNGANFDYVWRQTESIAANTILQTMRTDLAANE